jgi:putative oxidoreductase
MLSDDLGKLIARLSVSVLLLFHGGYKLLNGIEPIKHSVTGHHLPESIAYGVYLGELVGPILVTIGFFSRIGGALIAINMIVAVYLTSMHQLLAVKPGGGYALELETFYLIGGLCVILSGAGRFSVAGAEGPLN